MSLPVEQLVRSMHAWPTAFLCSLGQALLRKVGAMALKIKMGDWNGAASEALRKEKSSSTSEAIDWWLMMFPLWNAIPSEFVIKHPRLVLDRLYVSVA
eukprot:4351043-Pleurochrysis_carterae.AAC.1